MNDSEESPVFFFDDSDPERQEVSGHARATFRYFWRELSWEYRRIVPALDFACVKVVFADPPGTPIPEGQPSAEQMWVDNLSFDGETISGTLVNSPNWITSVAQGDEVEVPLNEITDWMYSLMGQAYGGFTVNLMRRQMDAAERAEHDEAWGIEFCDPNQVRLVPSWEEGQGPNTEADHPADVNMSKGLQDELANNPEAVHGSDELGWTLLHHLALAGARNCAAVLLECGADPNATTQAGRTPLQLARQLGWESMVELLLQHGAK